MRVTGTLMMVVAVAAARAGDPPAPAGDSIAAARKDFASIKPAGSPAESGPGPSVFDLKDDGPPPGGARTDPALSPMARSAADPSKKGGGTGNWLVDAMERRADPLSSYRDGLDLLGGSDRPPARASDEARLAEAGEKAASKEVAPAVFNPLDAFMTGWISAPDRELLLPAARGEGLLGAEQGKGRADTLPGLGIGLRETQAPPSRDAALADSRTMANPYVAEMDPVSLAPLQALPVPDFPGLSPAGLPGLSPGASGPGADPRYLDLSKSLAPDFTQPAEDDKYFWQMKRF